MLIKGLESTQEERLGNSKFVLLEDKSFVKSDFYKSIHSKVIKYSGGLSACTCKSITCKCKFTLNLYRMQ